MKRFGLIAGLTLVTFFASSQDNRVKSMVDSLQYLKVDTLDCSASLYWRIIAEGQTAISFLIDRLSDTTPTKARFACKQETLNVAEIAQMALTQIGEFPAAMITGMQFDVVIHSARLPCWSFYDFFYIDANKKRYQEQVRSWYNNQKQKYRQVQIPRNQQTDCQKKYAINSYLDWKG